MKSRVLSRGKFYVRRGFHSITLYISEADCLVCFSSTLRTSKVRELLPKETVTVSPGLTSLAGFAGLPLISMRPPEQASAATVRRFMTFEKFVDPHLFTCCFPRRFRGGERGGGALRAVLRARGAGLPSFPGRAERVGEGGKKLRFPQNRAVRPLDRLAKR